MQRRRALRYVGTAGLAALAGCLQGADQQAPDSATTTPAVTERSFEVTDSGPGSNVQSAAVTFGEGLTVTGTTTGANSCYTAGLASVRYDHPELRVTVRARQRDDAGMCTQTLTNVDYELRLGFAGPGPERVVVEHRSMGSTHTAATVDRTG